MIRLHSALPSRGTDKVVPSGVGDLRLLRDSPHKAAKEIFRWEQIS